MFVEFLLVRQCRMFITKSVFEPSHPPTPLSGHPASRQENTTGLHLTLSDMSQVGLNFQDAKLVENLLIRM